MSVSGERRPRRSSADDAARYIQRLIFDGQLRPGERVPQDDVANALGISRIPIREALIALEGAGWVTIELNRGAFVNALDEQAVRDHYELYGMVYGLAAQRALKRGAEGLDEELGKLVYSLQRTDDVREFWQLVLAFHDAVLRAAKSPRIAVVLRALSGLVPGNFFELVPAAIVVERRGLAAVARAVKRGDPDRAAQEYRRMMRRQADNVVTVFRARGVLPPPSRS
ncbi:MAG TPA: GntR family transcriptional regulator [Acidimicrobiales bacterium]|nr:GntR family transcriptional regulator [Acidimicrobiales bacterium]